MTNRWQAIQQNIWDCSACHKITRVEFNIRQQTDLPATTTKLLIVGIAPPYQKGVHIKSTAKSATNNSEDDLRKFLETSLQLTYNTLTERGLTILHAAKCAISPKDGHQNPPSGVVENCSPRHFSLEFIELKPPVVLSFGERARRAILLMPGYKKLQGLNLSGPLQGQYMCSVHEHTFQFLVSPFFKSKRDEAEQTLKAAARLAGIV